MINISITIGSYKAVSETLFVSNVNMWKKCLSVSQTINPSVNIGTKQEVISHRQVTFFQHSDVSNMKGLQYIEGLMQYQTYPEFNYCED